MLYNANDSYESNNPNIFHFLSLRTTIRNFYATLLYIIIVKFSSTGIISLFFLK